MNDADPIFERLHWDAVSGDDPSTMIRDGDWTVNTPADLKELPAATEGPILDLGCGLGRLSVAYARAHQVNVIGVDISPRMIERAEPDPLVSYKVCDGRVLPWLPPLAGAFSMLMFQHIPAAAQRDYVVQVAAALKPGARFVFQVVVGDEDVFLSHQVYVLGAMKWCEAAGLEIEGKHRGVWPEWVWVTARKPES